MHIDNEIKLDFQDVLIRPKRSTLESRSQVDLVRKFKTSHGIEFSGVPIIAANMATGTFYMLNVFSRDKMFVAIAKYNNPKWLDVFSDVGAKNFNWNDVLDYGLYTIGMSDSELNGLKEFESHLKKKEFRTDIKICIDIANGYTQKFAGFVSKVRKEFPTNVIVAGNVATPEMVQELIIAGADYVKVGIGPGSVCTTRMKAGVGYPQISAAIECADAAHGLGAGIILDGGMRCPGDVAKAFVANSDMVMIGGMFAGTDEQDGEIITRFYQSTEMVNVSMAKEPPLFSPNIIEKKFKIFYGMSSEHAQEAHSGGKKNYRTSEGRVEEIPYAGPVQDILDDLLGGLRSACTYIGSRSVKDMGKCGTLIRVSRQHDKF
jgi:GMP reductase